MRGSIENLYLKLIVYSANPWPLLGLISNARNAGKLSNLRSHCMFTLQRFITDQLPPGNAPFVRKDLQGKRAMKSTLQGIQALRINFVTSVISTILRRPTGGTWSWFIPWRKISVSHVKSATKPSPRSLNWTSICRSIWRRRRNRSAVAWRSAVRSLEVLWD